jgi:hypothetical protein
MNRQRANGGVFRVCGSDKDFSKRGAFCQGARSTAIHVWLPPSLPQRRPRFLSGDIGQLITFGSDTGTQNGQQLGIPVTDIEGGVLYIGASVPPDWDAYGSCVHPQG